MMVRRRVAHRGKKREMVEVVGVEPTSGKRVPAASTCVSFYLNLISGFRKKTPGPETSLLISGLAGGARIP
jgi:hypothetical protein